VSLEEEEQQEQEQEEEEEEEEQQQQQQQQTHWKIVTYLFRSLFYQWRFPPPP
jgi:hypothetical protein